MHKFHLTAVILLILLHLFLPNGLYSQVTKDTVFNSSKKEKTIGKISNMLEKNYVYPETAKKISVFLKEQMNSHAYDSINNPKTFAQVLTRDVQSISKDLHLKVIYNPDAAKRIKEDIGKEPDPEQEKQHLEALKKENFGFKTVSKLSWNIGYVDFRNFIDAKISEETVASAMAFIENSDAIIFDIRLNGGGDPTCVRLICSYLFGDKPVHLNDLYYRPEDRTEEYWTLKKVDGKKMPDIPVYILTSNYTFSAAEEFAYNLQTQKRAIIVGDTTGGGAHPGGTMAVNNDFIIFMPMGRAINPVTKTNWEGTGVIPDVPVVSENALETAQILALKKIAEGTKDENYKKYFLFVAESIEGDMNSPLVDENTLKSYSGIYGERKITYNSGKLYYRHGSRGKMAMTPISENAFMMKDLDYVRVTFDKDADGKVYSITESYDLGENESFPKTE